MALRHRLALENNSKIYKNTFPVLFIFAYKYVLPKSTLISTVSPFFSTIPEAT
jgi:hypothetical protein